MINEEIPVLQSWRAGYMGSCCFGILYWSLGWPIRESERKDRCDVGEASVNRKLQGRPVPREQMDPCQFLAASNSPGEMSHIARVAGMGILGSTVLV